MPAKIKVNGLENLRDVLQNVIQRKISRAMAVALGKSLAFIEGKAQEILDAKIYNAPRGEFAEPFTGNLRNSFVHSLYSVGTSTMGGTVGNTAEEAKWVEHGTGLYGPEQQEYSISPVEANHLHWIDPFTGEDRFSDGHYVSGQLDIHFMELALTQNIPEVQAIFKQEIAEALK